MRGITATGMAEIMGQSDIKMALGATRKLRLTRKLVAVPELEHASFESERQTRKATSAGRRRVHAKHFARWKMMVAASGLEPLTLGL